MANYKKREYAYQRDQLSRACGGCHIPRLDERLSTVIEEMNQWAARCEQTASYQRKQQYQNAKAFAHDPNAFANQAISGWASS